MSIHIGAEKGSIADTVLLPGDPLRAKYIAETFLEQPVCYNRIRGMLGYTGTYKGKKISIQGTGMGIPSFSIYVHELISFYGASKLIRIGSCGSIREDIRLRDIILALSASTDSAINKNRFSGRDFCPAADFTLLKKAYETAAARGIPVHAGTVFTTDRFYHDGPDYWKIWAANSVLAVEMETAALYSLAAASGREALSVLTVSDNIVTGSSISAEDRETTFSAMAELALETV